MKTCLLRGLCQEQGLPITENMRPPDTGLVLRPGMAACAPHSDPEGHGTQTRATKYLSTTPGSLPPAPAPRAPAGSPVCWPGSAGGTSTHRLAWPTDARVTDRGPGLWHHVQQWPLAAESSRRYYWQQLGMQNATPFRAECWLASLQVPVLLRAHCALSDPPHAPNSRLSRRGLN